MQTSTFRDHAVLAKKIWSRDASMGRGADEADWLGWLEIVDRQLARVAEFTRLAEEVKERGFKHAVLLGMGGASRGAEAIARTFGKQEGFPELFVLDSTDPAQIRAMEAQLNLERTVFLVANQTPGGNKPGDALETTLLKDYFFAAAKQDGSRFIAVTDLGSALEQTAKRDGFWKVYNGVQGTYGGYSALSDFGLIPAAVMGVDVPRLLGSAQRMVERSKAEDGLACPGVNPGSSPGAALGMTVGEHALQGRDKVTIVASPRIAGLGPWLEQLLAESTAKEGTGLIPVEGEKLGSPAVYGHDRVFVYVRYTPEPSLAEDKALGAVEHGGHTLIRLEVEDPYDLGGEFFRWEMAAAVAGAVLGVNPFDRADAEATERAARNGMERGVDEEPIFTGEGIRLYTDEQNAAELGEHSSFEAYIAAHLARIAPGDYFALLAYLERSAMAEKELQAIRTIVRDKRRVATCLEFGPRFLHATGPAYIAGPNTGVFLQITADDANDLAVSGERYTFGGVQAAQARGDFTVLVERKRRALRVHLSADQKQGLEKLHQAVQAAF